MAKIVVTPQMNVKSSAVSITNSIQEDPVITGTTTETTETTTIARTTTTPTTTATITEITTEITTTIVATIISTTETITTMATITTTMAITTDWDFEGDIAILMIFIRILIFGLNVERAFNTFLN